MICWYGTAMQPGSVVLLGAPFDDASTFLRGAAEAPARIREVLHDGASNLCAEDGTDLGGELRFVDGGDLEGGPEQLEEKIAQLLARGARVLSLGGDHAISHPIVRAYKKMHTPLTILQFDAHPDLYDEFEGDRHTHASPFARIMEEPPVPRLIQVGIRAWNEHLRAQARRFNVEVHEMRNGVPASLPDLDGPLYLSLDLDVFDPAFAPGVSHHEPGGMTTREVLRLIQSLEVPVVGADLVELNPRRDPQGITAALAAKLVKELAAVMLRT